MDKPNRAVELFAATLIGLSLGMVGMHVLMGMAHG